MFNRFELIVSLMSSYAVYPAMAGTWFAYLADVSPWIGGIAGVGVALLMILPTWAVRRFGARKSAPRDRLRDLLDA